MSRGALSAGTAGGIIGVIAAGIGITWSIIGVLLVSDLWNTLPGIISTRSQLFPVLFFAFSIILAILLIVSGALIGIGFFGMYQAGGGAMGVVGLVFGNIGGVTGGVLVLLGGMLRNKFEIGILGFTTYPYFYLNFGLIPTFEPDFLSIWVGIMTLGVSLILLGSASIAIRNTTANSSASVAAGVLSIVGGCFLFPYILGVLGGILAIVGFSLIFVSFILWAAVFYSSRDVTPGKT